MAEILKIFDASLLCAMFRISTPMVLGGLAYVICARAGIVDMGIEGKLLFGAFISAVFTILTGNSLLGILLAIVVMVFVSWIVSVLFTRLHAQQVIVGIALNFFMTGLTTVMLRMIWDQNSVTPQFERLSSSVSETLNKIPIIGGVFDRQTPIFYFAIFAVVATWLVLYYTKFGLRLRSIGENITAADSLGINVCRYQTVAMIVSGILCCIGGADLSVGQLGYFAQDISAGRGFIALACGVVGRFHPIGMLIVTLFISLVDALQMRFQGLFGWPPQIFQIIPYIAPIIILVSFGGAKAPSCLGKAYRRGER